MADPRARRENALRSWRQSARRCVHPGIARRTESQGHCHRAVRMSLHVIEPGLYSLIVDLGRPHHRGLGVPLGGPADRGSFAAGNAALGNPPDAAALEITLAGPTLRTECDITCVICGASFDAWI